MLNRTSLTAMWPQDEGVEATFSPVVVEDRHVGVHIVQVVGVGWVLVIVPCLGDGYITVKKRIFGFAFIIHRVEADDIPKIEFGWMFTLDMTYYLDMTIIITAHSAFFYHFAAPVAIRAKL